MVSADISSTTPFMSSNSTVTNPGRGETERPPSLRGRRTIVPSWPLASPLFIRTRSPGRNGESVGIRELSANLWPAGSVAEERGSLTGQLHSSVSGHARPTFPDGHARFRTLSLSLAFRPLGVRGAPPLQLLLDESRTLGRRPIEIAHTPPASARASKSRKCPRPKRKRGHPPVARAWEATHHGIGQLKAIYTTET